MTVTCISYTGVEVTAVFIVTATVVYIVSLSHAVVWFHGSCFSFCTISRLYYVDGIMRGMA